ncbi:hypothetical protein CQW23_23307 [Capsicum baccatum]|uniref:Glabrous enhancer-binding protein-like DBD domain-containing protein n=1 Tax=Capsicum baccatum TaxID=33114 RepID=A0A2G2VRJ4_CAPBA|nr:hypothetical protein CQW23_23307 [Capsicum baccatum]
MVGILGCGRHSGHELFTGSYLLYTILLANNGQARLEPVCTVLGKLGSCDVGIDEEYYLINLASSHMLVSKIKPCRWTIDYRSKKKADPIADLGTVHEFIKKSLHVDASKVQLQDKIRRLKKYMNNAGKERGKERVLTKAHEQKEYELSKKIWDKEKSDKWVQVEVVKVDNVAASMGMR